jgi:arylsulfatase A-like enzyme
MIRRRRWRAAQAVGLISAVLVFTGCDRRAEAPATQRLVDLYRPQQIEGSVPAPAAPAAVEWRFDGPMPSPAPRAAASTRGWEALRGVSGLVVREGRLAGQTHDAFPILHYERTSGLDDPDLVHEVQVRMRTSAPGNLAVTFQQAEKLDVPGLVEGARTFPWRMTSPVVPGEAMRTYTLTSPFPVPVSSTRHVLVRPADGAGAAFEIESVRVVTRREHLGAIASGVGWQGLAEVYRETIVARSPEVIRFPVRLPPRPWLDLALGTVEHDPVTFRVSVRAADEDADNDAVLLERTVTRSHRWESTPVDLERFAGQEVVLSLSLAAGPPNTLGFWGAPAVRSRGAGPAGTARDGAAPPQGVILVWADTLRQDHMSVYGHERPTTPVLDSLASEGAVFRDVLAQATWTKVATPSLLASLYPTSHGVRDFSDRLPSAATTMAEVYREAGYATLSLSSGPFTGRFTNLHQGFEEVHEGSSLPDQETSKTARDYVDRLLPWLEAHRDVPFFVFLHVTDPHDPFKPQPPYDTLWADPGRAEEHERHGREARAFIADPLLKIFGMPTRDELVIAGIDPVRYSEHDRAWYDGSIRGMDAEIGRVIERLRGLGLDRRTVLAFTADHGEEFFEHGRSFHGQSVYGELSNMPLVLWGPGTVAAGAVVEPTVQVIDVMPTLLELSGLALPEGAQGRSLVPLLQPPAGGGTVRAAAPARPAIVEKAETKETGAPPPRDTESTAIVSGQWKLIHNTKRPASVPEFELYDHARDPLDATDLAAKFPDVVQRLARDLAAWRQAAQRGRVKPDSEAAGSLSKEELERLRSLGYIQ